MEYPSAIEASKQLIEDNPHIFLKKDKITLAIIATALVDYSEKVGKYIYEDLRKEFNEASLLDAINKINDDYNKSIL